jgi:DNA-binding LytR/AlgR family response regulator
LWIPVGLVLAALLDRLQLGRAAFAATFLLAVPATLLHALAAGLLDSLWSPRMAAIGWSGATLARLPIDLLFYLAIAGATWALAFHKRSIELAQALQSARAAQERQRPQGAEPEQPLLVSIGNRRVPVPVDAVEWIGAAGNYVVVNWDAGEGLVRTSLQDIELRLDPERFARVHRSTLANLAMVESASALADGSWRLTMRSGAELVASRTYRDRILTRLGRR